MIPFSLTGKNPAYLSKLEELRLAYSERYRALSGFHREWTITGWRDSPVDVPLTAESQITTNFISGMQSFCEDNYRFFAPDIDYVADEMNMLERVPVVNNYPFVSFSSFVSTYVGGAMVDKDTGEGGWRCCTTFEVVDGVRQPVVFIGGPGTRMAFDHIIGEWVFDDLKAVLSRFTATAGECAGVYGDQVSGFGAASSVSSDETPVYLYGLTTNDNMPNVLSTLVSSAKSAATPESVTDFSLVAWASYYISAGYFNRSTTFKTLALDNGLPEDTNFYKWDAGANVTFGSAGGAEVLYAPSWMAGRWDQVASVEVFHFTDGVKGSTLSTGLSYIADRIYLGTNYNVSTSAPSPQWTDNPPEYTPPPEELADINPEAYAAALAEYNEKVAELALKQVLYGDWGDVPGFAWGSWFVDAPFRSYNGGLIRFSFSNGDPYVPQAMPPRVSRCSWSFGGLVVSPIGDPSDEVTRVRVPSGGYQPDPIISGTQPDPYPDGWYTPYYSGHWDDPEWVPSGTTPVWGQWQEAHWQTEWIPPVWGDPEVTHSYTPPYNTTYYYLPPYVVTQWEWMTY